MRFQAVALVCLFIIATLLTIVTQNNRLHSPGPQQIIPGPETGGSSGCNQMATTADCAYLMAHTLAPPPPWQPPAPTPDEQWTSSTGTPITFAGFSFTLPAGWKGEAYKGAYAGDWHVSVSKDGRSFAIDCAPAGKGLEAATRLTTEERTFTQGSTDYRVAYETWTAPGNDPWVFVWLRTGSLESPSVVCLARGSTDTEVTRALHELYQSWQ